MNKKPWWVFDPPRVSYVVVSSARKRYIWAFPRFRCRSVIRLTAAPRCLLFFGGGQIQRLGLGDEVVQIGGLQRAGLLEDDLALLGNHQRRHSLNAGSLSQILIGVDVHLDESDVRILRLVGRGFENRAECSARTAPSGPEVNEHDFVVSNGFSNSAEVMAVAAIEIPSSNTVLDAVYQFPSTTQHFGKSLCPKLNGLRAHGGDEALC